MDLPDPLIDGFKLAVDPIELAAVINVQANDREQRDGDRANEPIANLDDIVPKVLELSINARFPIVRHPSDVPPPPPPGKGAV
ncbi:hypothetical protein [Sphingomonas bacterium]|uniref:hypothetical protein n=1 Tax=Sphingomonas bacterium TaxID=1895847 RepID=UPI0015772831|nr:hypothetical protein [Sphingomonas bacterium]